MLNLESRTAIPLMLMIPLCVPFDEKDIAKRAGARFNASSRCWECPEHLLRQSALRTYLPRMYLPERAGPVLRPWLVPSPLWGINLRSLLPAEQWDVIRRDAYARAGRRCRVCGGAGDQWPVEADEAWAYDDDRCIQTLKGVIALCPRCHEVRHWGKTELKGRSDLAYAQLLYVNKWSPAEADAAIEEAFDLWERRSQKAWTSDISWVEQYYGFKVTDEGKARAVQVNASFHVPFAPAKSPAP